MFKFGKSKKTTGQEKPTNAAANLDDYIHVMPERFYIAEKTRHTGLTILIVAGVLLLLILSGLAVWVVRQPSGNDSTTLPQDTSSEAVNEIPNQPVEQPTATEVENSIELPTDNQAVVENEPAPESAVTAELYLDEDGDGLTLAEESLYASDSSNVDSDGDGFVDGQEVAGLYSPIQRSATLISAGLFKSYVSADYRLAYPSSWSIQTQPGLGLVVIDTGLTDKVQIATADNGSGQSLGDWLAQQNLGYVPGQWPQTTVNNLTVIGHISGFTYYFASTNNPAKFFIVSYLPALDRQSLFGATFQAIVRSFTLL